MSYRKIIIYDENWLWNCGRVNLEIRSPQVKDQKRYDGVKTVIPIHEFLGLGKDEWLYKKQIGIDMPVMPGAVAEYIQANYKTLKGIK